MSPAADTAARAPRLGAHSFTFREAGLDEALREAARAGADRVEVWAGHAHWSSADPDVTREHAAAAGLAISAYCVGGFYGSGRGARQEAARAFAFARTLGTELVTGCLGEAAYGPAGQAAMDAGVRMAVENHWYQALARPADLARLEAPALGLNLDTGHALLAGADPAEFARRAGPRLWNVHLKDVRRPGLRRLLPLRLRRRLDRGPHSSLPIGSGDLDLGGLERALRAVGYAGPLTVEVEGSPAPGAALLRSLEAARTFIGTS